MIDNSTKTILIVEDEPDLRNLYKEILLEAGYNVEEASDGIIGWNKIKNLDWHVLLLDIMLPGKDGIKILKDLSDTPDYKKGSVIALTNLNSDSIIKEVFSCGGDGYLIKSEITPDKILTEVAGFLNK